MYSKNQTGGCLCGAVRYELKGDSNWNVYCHCESCRKHTGAPVVAFVTFSPEDVRWTSGERTLYESSPGRFRGFCRDCGSSLTYEAEVKGHAWFVLHISSLDNPENFPPTEHVFHAEKLPWFDLDDNLPRHQGSKFI